MKFIVVQRKPDDSDYKFGLYVIASSHERFHIGKRFDYGFMGIAVEEGYAVTVLPMQLKEVF